MDGIEGEAGAAAAGARPPPSDGAASVRHVAPCLAAAVPAALREVPGADGDAVPAEAVPGAPGGAAAAGAFGVLDVEVDARRRALVQRALAYHPRCLMSVVGSLDTFLEGLLWVLFTVKTKATGKMAAAHTACKRPAAAPPPSPLDQAVGDETPGEVMRRVSRRLQHEKEQLVLTAPPRPAGKGVARVAQTAGVQSAAPQPAA
ncbi:unnamed protein product, partial [Prorocentrum cordatum]